MPTEQHGQYSRGVRVEGTGVACLALTRELTHDGDNVERGEALGLVDHKYAVHSSSSAVSRSLAVTSARVPFIRQPAAAA